MNGRSLAGSLQIVLVEEGNNGWGEMEELGNGSRLLAMMLGLHTVHLMECYSNQEYLDSFWLLCMPINNQRKRF